MLNITVVALLGTSSSGAAPRAQSIVHQMSHTQWPLIIQPASFAVNKVRSINLDMLTMLDTCAKHLPCLIVDGDVHFHRNIHTMLDNITRQQQYAALHLCPGCIYNRILVQKTGDIWANNQPEKRITAPKDPTGNVYTSIPFSTCWYGGPVAVLFQTHQALQATSRSIKRTFFIRFDFLNTFPFYQ